MNGNLIPTSRFMRSMGGASIIAGVIMLAVAPLMPRLRRLVNRKLA